MGVVLGLIMIVCEKRVYGVFFASFVVVFCHVCDVLLVFCNEKYKLKIGHYARFCLSLQSWELCLPWGDVLPDYC